MVSALILTNYLYEGWTGEGRQKESGEKKEKQERKGEWQKTNKNDLKW